MVSDVSCGGLEKWGCGGGGEQGGGVGCGCAGVRAGRVYGCVFVGDRRCEGIYHPTRSNVTYFLFIILKVLTFPF